jgi:5-hydroxyisourate hydrolase
VSAISTHVLDIAAGCPAAGLDVRLEHIAPAGPEEIARASTDSGGRITSLGPDRIAAGTYRLVFDTGGYQARHSRPDADDMASLTQVPSLPEVPFFPEVTVTFTVAGDGGHYHVPLLMSPFGYSTYRGS